MKGNRWTVWTAAVLLLALAAMALWAAPIRNGFSAVEPLPAAVHSAVPAPAEGRLDINTAGADELAALPGIGPVRAGAILDYREEHGPFRYPEELLYVPGIGEGTLAGLLDLITAGGE